MIERLLIIRFSALGDVAMTLPVIYSLANKYPDIHIDVITSRFCSQIFINAPENITVHGLDLKKDYSGVWGIWRIIRYIRKLKPDCAADLHNVLRTWIIDIALRVSGCPVKMLDKMRLSRKDVLLGKTVHPDMIKRYEDVFFKLGIITRTDFRGLFSNSPASGVIDLNQPAIGIAPFARYFTKTYPIDKMETVIQLLCHDGYHVYLFGAPGKESDILDNIADKYPNCHSLAGKYRLADELAVMSRMQLMVTMDSANNHLASIAGVRTLSIWGGTSPECGFMGYSQDPESAISLKLECKPCSIAGSAKCPKSNLKCMENIDPEIIVEKIRRIKKLFRHLLINNS